MASNADSGTHRTGTGTPIRNDSRTITFLRAGDWVRVIGLVSMVQCGALTIGGGAVIVGRLCGYSIFHLDAFSSGTVWILFGVMSISIAGLFLGMHLYDGVREKNPNKLLAWMLYAAFVELFLLFDVGMYFGFYAAPLNYENILGILICLTVYGFFLLLVNVHRQELLLMANHQRLRAGVDVEVGSGS